MAVLDQFDFIALSLFSASLDVVSSGIEATVRARFPPTRFYSDSGPAETGRVFKLRPPAGGAHLIRAMVFEPGLAVGTTAMLTNLSDGWLTLTNVLAGDLGGGPHVLVRTSVDAPYPVTDFEAWTASQSVRYVRSMRDEKGWDFHERGQPLPFEQPQYYKRRLIRDRLNRHILVEYLSRLGWNIADDQFWASARAATFLFERHKEMPSA